MLNAIIKFFLDNKLIVWLLLLVFISGGIVTAPFDLGFNFLPKSPVSVDAIPNIGENQQIIYTEWDGRSPQNVEDQITYPLTSALLGIPGVKSVRSNSMFGFSSIYLIFDDDIEFYWSRSRILEKLNSLPKNLLPESVQPTLGPDATALGQIFWYTLEGRDEKGKPTGGWDLQELRTAQDFYVSYGLSASEGVSEVASIGGFVKEYQVDVIPDKMKVYGISLVQVMNALKESNLDIGAQTIEINKVEYFVRGLGYLKNTEDIEESVVDVVNNVPIRIKDIANVSIGPATRRGILDKSGAPAVGGVVVARFGSNPMEVINNVKEKIKDLEIGMPSKVLKDGTVSKIAIVPFYDRTLLINETIGTLEEALSLEILITIIVVLLMLMNLKSSLLVSLSLPVAVMLCFVAMKYFGIEANIVALSGIAIAIGTMVDMGIVLTESMLSEIENSPPEQSIKTSIYKATIEVASAVITAVATTVVSFLPILTMEAAEGKLFKPLAYTKSFALIASIVIAITIIPALAEQLFKLKSKGFVRSLVLNISLLAFSIFILFTPYYYFGLFGVLVAVSAFISIFLQKKESKHLQKFDYLKNILYALLVVWFLSKMWMPLGVEKSIFINFIFLSIVIGFLIGSFYLVIHFYETILKFFLQVKYIFILVVIGIIFTGVQIFKNTKQEFLPSLDEGSFLLMPTAMPHAGMEMNEENLKRLDKAVTAIPEVETVVGKAGRLESALDPAPMSMYENIIIYKPEYKVDKDGHKTRFKVDKNGKFLYKYGKLIPDKDGQYFRQWRDHIKSPNDIWDEIVEKTKLPGITSAPKLQPIETRLVMLQTGMRAPMGIKVRGKNLKEIEAFGLQLEKELVQVEGIKKASVFAERIVGKPYLLLDIKRKEISKYGLSILDVQTQIQAAVGGVEMTKTVEGRERYAVRLRYPRELRNEPEKLKNIFISTSNGVQIKLEDIVDIKYEKGPQAIKSEDGFLVGYVLFDKEDGYSETEVAETAKTFLETKIADNKLIIPDGVSYKFAGNYEQQLRANKRLKIVIPIALMLIFLILYFQFKSVMTTFMVFTGVFLAFSGGFIMIWLYGQNWFMNFNFFGENMRDLFQMQTINLSIAVWVGFLALFGIATDDGVLVGTFLKDSFKTLKPTNKAEIHTAVLTAGLRRVKPAMMTTATTILALLPILTSTGKGSDIMLPMAIPSFGGMVLNVITMFTVPVLYCSWEEIKLFFNSKILTK